MRLIDGDELSYKLATWLFSADRENIMETDIKFNLVKRWVDNATTIPPNYVIRGWWDEDETDKIICSNCTEWWDADELLAIGDGGFGLPKYCPHCGAKMDALKEADDE